MTKYSLTAIVSLISIFVFVNTVHAKKYKIACLHDYYPYTSINDQGKASGIIVDWWRLWSEKTGIDIEFVPSEIDNIDKMLVTGDVDILAGVYFVNDSAQQIDLFDSILSLRSVMFLRDQLDPSDSLMATITLLSNSMAEKEVLKRYPNFKINSVNSYSLIREEAKLEDCDGFVYDIPNPKGNYNGIDAPKGYYEYATLYALKLRPAVLKKNTQVLRDIMAGSNSITPEEFVFVEEEYDLYEDDKSIEWIVFTIFVCFLIAATIFIIYVGKQKRKNKNLIAFEEGTDWQTIIAKGENDSIEFKSSLRWDYRQEKTNKALEMVIVKTISAFLNTQGGMLFIGVDDDGNALGLEPDYNSYSKKNRDGFLLGLTNLINQNLGKRIHQFLNINIVSVKGKEVCVVNIEKSDKPVFIEKSDKEEFYIRTSASSQPLSMRESYEYIQSHW